MSIDPVQHILFDIEQELEKAKKKHPFFPVNPVERCAIMAEEAGEAVQAANDLRWDAGTKEDFQTELLQTAAMCVRILEAMENDEKCK
jgi:NTP pyrophosphatase (non-canonical NTP hydrolase)